jgi:hypothetical protein
MIKLDQLYLMYKEERLYSQKTRYQKSRKLVLYRQMINATNRALETLKAIHRFENELYHMPAPFQQIVRSQLDSLLHYHEQILLKFIGKAKFQQESTIADEAGHEKKRLVEAFYEYNEQGNEYHLFSLIGTITIKTRNRCSFPAKRHSRIAALIHAKGTDSKGQLFSSETLNIELQTRSMHI